MYLLKLQPSYFDAHKWGVSDAYRVLTDPSMGITPYYIWDGDKNWWSPLSTYAATSMVKRGQYVYYSTKADNTDDPFYHWVGCTPEGNNSWIRGRGLHDYDCINYVNPGCTQRYSYTEFQYIPKKTGNDLDVTLFYGDALPKYLVLHGLFSADCTVDFYNSTGGTSQASVVCNTTEQPWDYMAHKRIIRDTSARTNPEIPRYLKDTIFLPVVNDTYRIVIKGGSNGIGIKFLGMASAVKIGKTEGSSLSVGAVDYSRIAYDDWGKMSLAPGKKAKTLEASVHLIHKSAEQEEKILRMLQSCRATPTIFWAANTLPENIRVSSLPFVFGLLKNSSADENNPVHKVLSLSIDGIPSDYAF